VIRLLQIYLAPLLGVGLTLWAAVVALAVEAYAPLPRMLAHRGRRDETGVPSLLLLRLFLRPASCACHLSLASCFCLLGVSA